MKFTQSARRHRIGKAHVLAVLNAAGNPQVVPADAGQDERLVWIGEDDRAVVLEVIGIDLPDCLLIIHVMPYRFRRTS